MQLSIISSYTKRMKTITLDFTLSKTRHIKLSTFLATLCCLFFSFRLTAQPLVDCGEINCTASDVQIVKAYFADADGNAISCPQSGTVAGYLHVVLSTNTPRKGVSVSGDLIIDGNKIAIGACFGDELTGSNNDLKFPNTFQIECTSIAYLERSLVSWGVGNDQYCSGEAAQCPATKSKCRFTAGTIPIPVKLDVFFDWQAGDCANSENGLSVQFTSQLELENVTIDSYAWNFGDGNTSDQPNPTHTYSTGGSYSVTLEVIGKDNEGKVVGPKRITLPVTVAACCNLLKPEIAPFTFCELEGKTFGDLLQDDGDGGFYNWFDAEDNGLVSTNVIPVGTHTYYVSLSKNNCVSERAAVTVTVTEKVTPIFTQIDPVCSGNTILLPTTSANNITGSWSPAVNNTATTTYTFTPDEGQCAITATMTVTVKPLPGIAVKNLTNVCPVQTVNLADALTAGTGTLGYFLADGSTPVQNPSAVSTSGTYWIELTGENGCPERKSITVTIANCAEGCTPGYWKNRKASWNTISYVNVSGVPYNSVDVRGCIVAASNALARQTPSMTSPTELSNALFRNVFDLTDAQVEAKLGKNTKNITLLQALGLGDGSGYTQLARAGTAALLNQCAMNYAPSTSPEMASANIVSNVKTQFTGTDRNAALALAQRYDGFNNSNCLLTNSGVKTTITHLSVGGSAEIAEVTKLSVSAFPNPFTDRIRFTIQAPKAGRATLEVYNMLGQKVGVPFEGQLNAGETRNVEYIAPVNHRSNLIYMLRMNGEQVSGKLMSTRQ